MSLRQFEYLVAIVDEGSFTRAAEALHVTQPALSHQVRALERSFGGPLLERLPRSVRLTPMGRAVLPHARAALADTNRAHVAARQASGLLAGELQVATVYSISLGILPSVLRAWHHEHPAIEIRLLEFAHADQLASAMAAGQADVAIGPVRPGWTGPVHPLGTEEFVVVLPPGPARRRRRVALESLADRAWVHYSPDNGLADVLDQACAAAGFKPRAAVRTEQSAAAPVLAAAGLGPALVPANLIGADFDGQVLRPDPPVRRELAAYCRGDGDSLTAAFVECLTANATLRLLRTP